MSNKEILDNEQINFLAPVTFQVITKDDVESSHGLRLFTSYQSATGCLDQMMTTGLVVPIINMRAILNGDANYEAVMNHLARTIFQAALNEAGGSPTTAARRLRMKHQTFLSKLKQIPGIKRNKKKKRRRHLLDHTKRAPGLKARMSEVLDT